MYNLDSFKVLLPAILAFLIGIIIAPHIARFLHKNKLWKKKNVIKTIDGKEASITASIHNDEKAPVPRLGGVVVWASVFITALLFYSISKVFPIAFTEKLDFISRNQTWLPLFAMFVGAVVGAIDDLLVVEAFGSRLNSYIGGGLSFPVRLAAVSSLGGFAGWWFFAKLGVSSVYVPWYGDVNLGGLLFILFFITVTLATFSTGVIDGVDGLSGGVMSAVFIAYGMIAYVQGQVDIATLCFVIVGGLIAFLWFNIPPASFYLTETGMLALSLSLSVIAFLTDAVMYLPIIAFPLLVTTASVILQLFWKKVFKRKLFLVAPLHHHFQAKGWPAYKVSMRYWIVSYMCALFGVVLVLVS
ncbi:MAG: phospho-N-acetylmuramoyl-pentapeptide-transferase, phospho-N-acetylmuramoyl-pentapeptide-transferase [Candidatus Parcubacteria bacterium]|jgi:phospho-N-acetylmuramoyl-pentapeptide-transferase